MTRPLGLIDGRTRSEPLLGGGGDVKMLDVGEGSIPLTPNTSTTMTVSPVGSESNGPAINGEGEKPNPESGPFIKSGGFFGKWSESGRGGLPPSLSFRRFCVVSEFVLLLVFSPKPRLEVIWLNLYD